MNFEVTLRLKDSLERTEFMDITIRLWSWDKKQRELGLRNQARLAGGLRYFIERRIKNSYDVGVG